MTSGKTLYRETGCAGCHLFRGEGGVTGPDLTLAANKFAARELLMHITEPSKIDDVRIWKHALVDEQVRNLIAP